MDMPDKIGLEFRFTDDGYIHRVTFGDTSYTRTNLAQSLADALEGILDYEGQLEDDAPASKYGSEKYKSARAALANYRKGE